MLLVSTITTICAQNIAPITGNTNQNIGNTNQNTAVLVQHPIDTPYAVTFSDGNSRVWKRTTFEKSHSGQWIPHLHSFTELATGLNHQNPQTGEWLESKDEINIMADGTAAATNGQQSVYFPANIYSGFVELVTPDGEHLKSRPMGISYFDGTNSVLIAELTNSVGQLVSSNQVIYTNAFTDFEADLVMTYRKSGFEADLVIRSQPPAPEVFGLSSQHCRMELLTEFFDTPDPIQTPAAASSIGGLGDTTLQFGRMRMIRGKAFAIGNPKTAIPVSKTWEQMSGRTFLIEAVPVLQISSKLQSLPVSTAASVPIVSADPVLHKVSATRLLPPERIASEGRRPKPIAREAAHSAIQFAKYDLDNKPGVVWDYNIVNSTSNMVFQGDTTYYVSGSVNLSGTTTIEGGTVIKYDTNYDCSVNILGTVQCETGPYHPAVLTSVNDAAVGEQISTSGPPPCTGTVTLQIVNNWSQDLNFYVVDGNDNTLFSGTVTAGSSGTYTFTAAAGQCYGFNAYDQYSENFFENFCPNLQNGTVTVFSDGSTGYSESGDVLCTPPVTASTGLSLANGGSLHDLIIRYLGEGVQSSGTYSVTNLQVVQCQTAAFDSEDVNLYAGNVLISQTAAAFGGQGFNVTSEQLTYDQGNQVTYSWGPGSCVATLVNALITGVSSNGNAWVNTNAVVTLPSGSGVYQIAGAGSYYLGTNSLNFIGTTNISHGMLAQLRQKTVYPPIVYSDVTISTNMEFGPQVPRDTNTMPRLGYHYCPLDWCFGGVTANSNLTFDAGTAVGWFETGNSYGIALSNDATNSFNGTALSPCIFARYSTVQEGGNGNWTSKGSLGGISTVGNPSYFAEIDAKFTQCYGLNWDPNHFRDYYAQLNVHANNCEFYCGNLAGYWFGQFFTNCLFYRIPQVGSQQKSAGLFWRNCTMYGSQVYAVHSANQYWPVWIENCAFDGSTVDMNDYSNGDTNTYCNFNAFLNGAQRLIVQGANDIVVTNTFTWQTGPLGVFYQATNSPLVDKGSVTADVVGLCNFTTQTNQTEEAMSVIDIGYHYIALDQYGNILDSDDDCLPDPWELQYFGTLAFSGTNLDCFGNTLLYDFENGLGALAVPVITAQPTSVTNKAGDSVTFTVSATNNPPVLYQSYQWVCDGTNIPGATSRNLTLSNVQLSNAGSYWAVVSSTGGMVESTVAQLSVVGVSRIIEDGILPEISGSASIPTNATINLRVIPEANPSMTNFPPGAPIWRQLSGTSLTIPSTATNRASFTPTAAGQYVLAASCGLSSNTYTLTVVDGSDSNYDGIPDSTELPYAPQAWQTELGSWRFDTPDWAGIRTTPEVGPAVPQEWIGAQGQLPISYTNILLVSGWSVGALEVNSNNGPAWLLYPEINTNSSIANINCRQGSIRFWFRPDWSSANEGGTGPQTEARLIEIGKKGTTNGCFGLYIDPTGTSLYFCSQTNSTSQLTPVTNLAAAIGWNTGLASTNWHHLTLTYSITNSILYIDGAEATVGIGVSNWPGPGIRTQGFSIGNSPPIGGPAGSTNWVQGRFDNFETFNYVLGPDYATNYDKTHSTPPVGRTNFCQLAPFAVNFPLAQTLTNGQIVTTTNDGSGTGNFGWLNWECGNSGASLLAQYLTNLNSVNLYQNPSNNCQPDALYIEEWVNSVTGSKSSLGQYLNLYTNAPSSNNNYSNLIGVVLWDGQDASHTVYQVAGFANIALITYQINGQGSSLTFAYEGARACNAYSNQPPICYIVSPTNNQIFTEWNTNLPETIPITAAASDPEDGLVSVAFYSSTDPNSLGTNIYYQAVTNANTNLFTYIWTNAPHGSNYLTAIATDEFGATNMSARITNIVNWPPQVSAGPNIVTNWPEGATNTLAGTVTDDGLPSGIITNISWTVLSSNGPVTFTNPTGTNTQVIFTTNGTYVLELSASDGVVTGTNTCTVIVRPRPFTSITAPTNNAIITQGTPITLSATAYDSDGIVTNVQFFNGTTFIGNAIQVSSNSYTFIWRNAPNAVESLIAVATDNDGLTNSASISFVVNQPPRVNAGPTQIITLPVTNVIMQATVTDDGLPPGSSVTSIWSVVSSNGPVSFSDVHATNATVGFVTNGIYILQLTASDGAAQSSSNVTIIVNERPQVNAGTNRIIRLTGSNVTTTLVGTVTDDGLPPGAPVTGVWTVVSATNGTVTFGNSNSFTTSATFTNSGGYVLQLTANDTVSTNSSQVTVIVNRPPSANAGTNQTLIWIEGQTNISTSLVGSNHDDGYPYGILTNLWIASGPGTVTFSAPTNTSTTATFSTNGIYSVSLIVGDGDAFSTNTCTITIWRRPFANIISPTNGAFLLFGSPITNIATAYDLDGFVTNLEMFDFGTNLINVTGTTASISLSNRVDWYRGESNANDSVGINNGSALSNMGYTNGVIGQAFSFNGTNGYVSIPDSASLDSLTNHITIEFWMKSGTTNNNPDWRGLVTKGNSSWRVMGTSGAKTVDFAADGLTPNLDTGGTRIVNDGNWHHVAAVYDGTNLYLYVDGTLDASRAASGTITKTSDVLAIGNDTGAPPGYSYLFNGLIDEVSIYNRALSSQEIQSIYNAKQFVWTNAPAGTNVLTAVATDNSGLNSTSAPVTITVGSALPVVQITSPTNNQLFLISPTIVTINATATSSAGTITNVQFLTNGVAVGAGILVSNAYTFYWSNVVFGTYSLTAQAADSAGNIGTSTAVPIVVNAVPTVQITSPTNVQEFREVTNVTITATASDADGDNTITNISLYGGTNNSVLTLLGNTTNSSFSFVWSNLMTGYYPVTAVAIDNRGASNVSQICIFKVTPTNPPPWCSITSPTNGETFGDGSDITITATATNYPASVTNVEFFVNGISIGSDPDAPYGITKCCWKPGTYQLIAVATDNLGSRFASTNEVQITIVKEPPTGQGFWDAAFHTPDSAYPSYTNAVDPCGNILDLDFIQSSAVYGSDLFLASQDAADGIITEVVGSLYKWDGTNWFRWGPTNSSAPCHNLPLAGDLVGGVAVDNSGIYADGEDTNGDGSWAVYQFDGTNWNQLGGSFSVLGYYHNPNSTNDDSGRNFDLDLPRLRFVGADLYLYGDFVYNTDTNVQYIAKWSSANSTWEQVGSPLNAPVFAVTGLQGNLIVGGMFTQAGGNINANHVAELMGSHWENLGAGVGGTNYDFLQQQTIDSAVFSLATCDTNVYVGGDFTYAGDQANANGIAVWNGSEWKTIGGGLISVNEAQYGPQQPTQGYASFSDLERPIVYTITPHGNSLYIGGNFTAAANPDGSQVSAASIVQATWQENTQQWTWSDMDGGVWWPDSGVDMVVNVFNTAIVNGPTPGAYDVIVGGDLYTANQGGPYVGSQALADWWGVARWRVGYPPPPSNPTVTITSPLSPAIFTNPPAIYLYGVATSGYTNIHMANFYTNGVQIGSSLTSLMDNTTNYVAFSNEWDNPSSGVYLIKAGVTDDGGLAGQSAPLVISIKDTNNPIMAIDDQYAVPQGTLSVDLPVLTNDNPSAGLTISQVTSLNNNLGTVSIGYNGTYLTYRPRPNVFGTDIFYYTVTNSSGAVDSASVTVNIVPRPVITAPADGDKLVVSSPPITVTAETWNFSGSITNVAIYTNGAAYGSLPTGANGAVSTNWTANTAGFYTFVAVATGNTGVTTTSAPVTVILTNTTPSAHGPVGVISNLVATTNDDNGIETVNLPLITQGFFDLLGQASDPDGLPVSYAVQLFRPQDWDFNASDDFSVLIPLTTPFADVTPGPKNGQGFHTGGDASGDLGNLDLTGVPNGIYDLALRVRAGSDETDVVVRVQLQSELKIGQFSFSEQDLSLPVNGIPLTVVRTYNSLNPDSGVFGASWSFALSDMDVKLDDQRTDVTIGTDSAPLDDDDSSGNGLPGVVNMRTGGGWDVTLTLPDGRRTTFQFGYDGAWPNLSAKWTPPPGVNATLETINPNDSSIVFGADGISTPVWANSDLTFGDAPFDNQDIPGWVLTTKADGIKYYITRSFTNNVYCLDPAGSGLFISARVCGPPKLTKVALPSNAYTLITDNGIFSYDPSGNPLRWSVFDRDAAGRISAIHDPVGGSNGIPIVQYVYDNDNNNLIQVLKLVDRNAVTYTTNKYNYDNPNFPHYITAIENGDGIPVARNYYDDSGRLTAVQDANGNTTYFNHSTTNNTDIVVDRLGNTNSYVYNLQGNLIWQTNALGQVGATTYGDPNNPNFQTAVTNAYGTAIATWTLYAYDSTGNATNLISMGHTSSFSYDANGELLSRADALGNVTSNFYDDSGNLTNTAQYDANNHVVAQSSSAYTNGYLTQTLDANGQVTGTFGYDSNGNLTNSTDANGLMRSFAYDANGNQISSSYQWTPPGGGSPVTVTTSTHYDAQNRITQTVDAFGNTNSTFYDSAGRVAYTVDKFGNTNSFLYDALGDLIQTTYPNGTFVRTVYDAAGRAYLSTDRNGTSGTMTSYDAQGHATNVVRFTNVVVSITYNGSVAECTLNSATGPICTNSTVYDAAGRVLSKTSPDGTTSYDYYPDGQLMHVIDPLNDTNFYAYDAADRRTNMVDALSHSTKFQYDALGRTVATIYNDNSAITNVFNNLGQRTEVVDQAKLVTQFSYNVSGQLTNVIKPPVLDPENGGSPMPVWSYIYDTYGNPVATVDPKGRATTNTFDAFRRQFSQRLPVGQTNYETYNSLGQVVTNFDFKGQWTKFAYDQFGRTKAKFFFTSAGYLSNSVCYEYDELDRITNITERYGDDAATNSCDGYLALVGLDLGPHVPSTPVLAKLALPSTPLIAVILLCAVLTLVPSGRKLRQMLVGYYLQKGWKVALRSKRKERSISVYKLVKWRPSYFWRAITVLTVIALIADDSSWDRSFAQCTPPVSSNVANSTFTTRITSYTYDFDGHITQMNSPEGYINYGYDFATGRLTNTCTANSDIAYGYDALGRLQTVHVTERNGSLVDELTTYRYDKVGNRSEVDLPNGISTTYFYDSLNRLTNVTHEFGSTTNLASYTYTLNSSGRRTNAVEIIRIPDDEGGGYLTNTLSWQFDGLYRLTNEVNICSATGASYTNAYVYDLAGNRLKLTQVAGNTVITTNSYDANDELLQEVTQNNGVYNVTNDYAYDANGSVVGKTNISASGSTTIYTYDLRNKLSSVTSGVSTTSFQYNDQGIRVRAMGASTKYYLIDANNHTGYQQVLEEFSTLGGTPTMSYVVGDDVLAQGVTGSASYLLADGHGSTRQVFSPASGIAERYSYDGYGKVQTATSSSTAEQAADNVTSHLYCGEQYDSALQMYNLRARYYNPGNGSFNQRDAFTGYNDDPQSLHKYTYSFNDPLNGIDPTGKFTLMEIMVATFNNVYIRGAITNVMVNFLFSALLGQKYTWQQALWDATTGALLGGFAAKGPALFQSMAAKLGWESLARICLTGFMWTSKAVLSTAEAILKRKIIQGKDTSPQDMLRLLTLNLIGQWLFTSIDSDVDVARERAERWLDFFKRLANDDDVEHGFNSFLHIWTRSSPFQRDLIRLQVMLFGQDLGEWDSIMINIIKDLVEKSDEKLDEMTGSQD